MSMCVNEAKIVQRQSISKTQTMISTIYIAELNWIRINIDWQQISTFFAFPRCDNPMKMKMKISFDWVNGREQQIEETTITTTFTFIYIFNSNFIFISPSSSSSLSLSPSLISRHLFSFASRVCIKFCYIFIYLDLAFITFYLFIPHLL